MKKIILSLLTVIFAFSLSAQVKFEPQVRINAGVAGVEDIKSFGSVEGIAGLRLGNKWRLGVGTGVSVSTFDNRIYDEISATSVPVFLDAKFNIVDTRVSPYIHLDAGYDFVINSEYDIMDEDGARLTIGAGVDIKLPYGAVTVGIDYMERDWDVFFARSVNLTVGFVFQSHKKKERLVTPSVISY